MQGQKIIYQKPREVALIPFDVSEPKDNEVVVKVLYTLISSGTEKAYLSASNNTAKNFPAKAGYSSVGFVVKKGSKVKSFQEGDRVFVAYGGHASYNVSKTTDVFKIPNGLSYQEAVFVKCASYPLLALRRARMELGESVVVVGLGVLGLFGVQIARIAGAQPLIAVGNRDIRREKAKLFGADYVFEPDDPELAKKILSITEEKTLIRGANVIIETSGSESGLLKSLTYTSKRARVMLNGCNRVTTQPIDLYKYIHTKGVSLIGVHNSSRMPYNSAPGNWTSKKDYHALFGYMLDGRLNAKDMISEYASPNDASEVYQRLLNDRNFPLGVIFDWEHFEA